MLLRLRSNGGSTNVHGHASIRILDESRVAASLVDPQTLVRQTTARDSSGRIVDNSAFGAGWVGGYGWREVDSFLGLECLFAASSRRVARRPSMVRGGACGGRRRRCGRRNGRGVHSRSKRFSVDGVGHSHGGRRSRDRGGVERAGNACTEDFDPRRSSPGPRRNLLVWTWEALRQKCLPIGSFCREGPRAGVPIWYPVRVRIARSWSSRNVLRKVWDSIPSKLFCVSSFRRSRTHCGSQSLLCSTMPAGKRAVVYVEFPDDFLRGALARVRRQRTASEYRLPVSDR